MHASAFSRARKSPSGPLTRLCIPSYVRRPIFLTIDKAPQGCDWSANYILFGVTFPVSCPIIPAETTEDLEEQIWTK